MTFSQKTRPRSRHRIPTISSDTILFQNSTYSGLTIFNFLARSRVQVEHLVNKSDFPATINLTNTLNTSIYKPCDKVQHKKTILLPAIIIPLSWLRQKTLILRWGWALYLHGLSPVHSWGLHLCTHKAQWFVSSCSHFLLYLIAWDEKLW